MNPHIEWETLEFHHEPKSADWYWALGIIFVTAAILAFIFNNLIFGIFLLVSGLALGIHARLIPEVKYYAITTKGVVVGDNMYPYEILNCFWIENLRHVEHLHPSIKSHILFKSTKMTSHIISIPIHADADIEEARSHLLNYLPEKKIIEPLHYKIMERLGF